MSTSNEIKPENTEETGRNPDGTWKKGFCPNPGGRPRNPLKEFSMREFESWDDDKKREFLEKISPFDRWRMTEGNPQTNTDLTSDGKAISVTAVNWNITDAGENSKSKNT